MEKKIKILFLAAGADDESRKRSEREARAISERLLASSKGRDSFELITRWAVRASDLQQHLLEHQPHIVHLSSGATATGEILLPDDSEDPRPVSLHAMAALFRILIDNIRVVVLNVPHADGLARELRRLIDFAISMRGALDGEAAVKFSAHLYQALGYGRTVPEGFNLAVNQLMLDGKADYRKPTLYVKAGADPLLRLRPESTAVAGTPETVRQSEQTAGRDTQLNVSQLTDATQEPKGSSSGPAGDSKEDGRSSSSTTLIIRFIDLMSKIFRRSNGSRYSQSQKSGNSSINLQSMNDINIHIPYQDNRAVNSRESNGEES